MRKTFIVAVAAILIVSMSSCGYIGGEQTPTVNIAFKLNTLSR